MRHAAATLMPLFSSCAFIISPLMLPFISLPAMMLLMLRRMKRAF